MDDSRGSNNASFEQLCLHFIICAFGRSSKAEHVHRVRPFGATVKGNRARGVGRALEDTCDIEPYISTVDDSVQHAGRLRLAQRHDRME